MTKVTRRRQGLALGTALAVLPLATLLASTSPAHAGLSTTDPLHAFCVSASCPSQNFSGGPVLTTTTNPPPLFGFYQDPGFQSATDFLLEVLVPNNETTNPGTIGGNFTGNATATGTLEGNWNSGFLDGFLGISASPSNPLSALIGASQSVDAGATGYSVYQYDFGAVTFGPSSGGVSPPDPTFLVGSVPIGTVFVGFALEGGSYIATANSSSLADLGPPTTSAPEPASLALLGTGLLGLGLIRRWRRRT